MHLSHVTELAICPLELYGSKMNPHHSVEGGGRDFSDFDTTILYISSMIGQMASPFSHDLGAFWDTLRKANTITSFI